MSVFQWAGLLGQQAIHRELFQVNSQRVLMGKNTHRLSVGVTPPIPLGQPLYATHANNGGDLMKSMRISYKCMPVTVACTLPHDNDLHMKPHARS